MGFVSAPPFLLVWLNYVFVSVEPLLDSGNQRNAESSPGFKSNPSFLLASPSLKHRGKLWPQHAPHRGHQSAQVCSQARQPLHGLPGGGGGSLTGLRLVDQPPRTPERGLGICQQTRAKCWPAAPRAGAKSGVLYNLKRRTPLVSERTRVPCLHSHTRVRTRRLPQNPTALCSRVGESPVPGPGALHPVGFQQGGSTGARVGPDALHTWPGTPPHRRARLGGPIPPPPQSKLQLELFPAAGGWV